MAARLVPTLIDEMRVERPDLRNLEFLVPPDMAVRARLDEVLAPFRLVGIDENDAVVALLHDAAALGQARRIVAVVAHGGHVGDVDHRNLPALLLQDVDPPVAVLRHRFRVARPVVADILVHGRKRAQIAVGALGDIDDHVPFFHPIPSFVMAGLVPAISLTGAVPLQAGSPGLGAVRRPGDDMHAGTAVPLPSRSPGLAAATAARPVMTADAVISPAPAGPPSGSRAPRGRAPSARTSPTCAQRGRPTPRSAPASWRRRASAWFWSACARA